MKKIISLLSVCVITILGFNSYTVASVKENMEIQCSGCAQYGYHIIEKKGVYYIEYTNNGDKYYQLIYRLTKKDGSTYENRIEVKPKTKTKLKIGKGTDLKIIGGVVLEK